MSVIVKQPEGYGSGKFIVIAKPDSGKAYWEVKVETRPHSNDPMLPVVRAIRRATRIDKQFSIAQIEKRNKRKKKQWKSSEKS